MSKICKNCGQICLNKSVKWVFNKNHSIGCLQKETASNDHDSVLESTGYVSKATSRQMLAKWRSNLQTRKQQTTTSEEKHRVLFAKPKAPTASSTHCVSEAVLEVMCFQLMLGHWHFKYFAKSLDRFNPGVYFGGKGNKMVFTCPPPNKKKTTLQIPAQLSTLETVHVFWIQSSPGPNAWDDSKMHHYRFAHQLSGHLSYTAKTYRGVNLHNPWDERYICLHEWVRSLW